MTFKLEFETDNQAFCDPYEITRLIREIAILIDEGIESGIVRDHNGNKVGFYGVDQS